MIPAQRRSTQPATAPRAAFWKLLLVLTPLIALSLQAHHAISSPEMYRSTGNTTNPPSAPPHILAAYQAWHGLSSHKQPPPYISTDPAVIARHIRAAKDLSIEGFVVDWYGAPDGLPNDADRAFIDQATAELLRQAGEHEFLVALMYDENTVSEAASYQAQVIRDLGYAKRYFTMPAYLKVAGKPALFIFPNPDVDSHIDWADVRQKLGVTITLLDQDPDPSAPAHDAQFDGFYAWVKPTTPPGWSPNGEEWGRGYLEWFYQTMLTPDYTHKVTVGGVWPGFDDRTASWGMSRLMSRRCGRTWRDTGAIAAKYAPPYVLIATWNDFEEGSDIENGTGFCGSYAPLIVK